MRFGIGERSADIGSLLIHHTEVTTEHNGSFFVTFVSFVCETPLICGLDIRSLQRSAGGAPAATPSWESVFFLASGGGAFLAEGGADFLGEVGDGAFIFRGSCRFLDVAAGGGALFGARHGGLTFLFLSSGRGFLTGAGTIGFRAFAGGGVSLAGQGAMRGGGARFFLETSLSGAGTRPRWFLPADFATAFQFALGLAARFL